jgi:arylsulfatase A-like enzyme
MDFFPTLCEAAGVPVTHTIEGRSFLPVLRGESREDGDRLLYWVRREGFDWGNRPYWGQDYHAVRRGDLKLLHNNAFGPLEMYDLAADPLEAGDLAKTGHAAEAELARLMQEQVRLAGAVPWRKRDPGA